MGIYFNTGNSGFDNITKSTYVDKTELIEYINSTINTSRKLTCFSRPRRFGKSFAAKMLCAYYDKSCDSRILFDHYKISASPSYLEHLNKYNVIYLDITWFLSKSKKDKLNRNIVCLLQDDVIRELHKFYSEIEYQDSLPEMLLSIAEQTGDKFFIIIDEWDALFRESKEDSELQKEYIELLRSLFKSGEITDKMIAGAYMTGILPIKKYGTQSALTDFREFSMLRPEPLEKFVGFTAEEVISLCQNTRLSFKDFQKWYDGYELGDNTHIYSPNSVIEAIQRGKIGNYWTQSETYESLKSYIDINQDGLQDAVFQMLGGAHIPLDVETFQNDLTSINGKDDVLTLLIHLGYLAYHYEEEAVSIPNEEVKREFLRAVKKSRHQELIHLIQTSKTLLEQTLTMNSEAVAKAVEEIHTSQTAPTFYNNEQALRSVIRMAYITCIDEYQEIQELPTGTGYADIVFLPKKNSMHPALLIELKWNKTPNAAISQIKQRNYPQIIKGITKDLLLVGINYDKKTKKHTCIIEKFRS